MHGAVPIKKHIIMKKYLFAFIMLALSLSHTSLQAQTALYMSYVKQPEIDALCVTGYPIGNGQKVTVTILEAQDSATCARIIKELKALPKAKNKASKEEKIKFPSTLCNSDTGCYDAKRLVPYLELTELNAREASARESRKTVQFSVFSRQAKLGDKGTYLIWISATRQAVLVFHCPNDEVYHQVIRYIVNKEVNTVSRNQKK